MQLRAPPPTSTPTQSPRLTDPCGARRQSFRGKVWRSRRRLRDLIVYTGRTHGWGMCCVKEQIPQTSSRPKVARSMQAHCGLVALWTRQLDCKGCCVHLLLSGASGSDSENLSVARHGTLAPSHESACWRLDTPLSTSACSCVHMCSRCSRYRYDAPSRRLRGLVVLSRSVHLSGWTRRQHNFRPRVPFGGRDRDARPSTRFICTNGQ